MAKQDRKIQAASSPGPVYFFGGIGALVYYIQLADGFWGVVLAFLKAIVWPAFVTYDLLKFIT
jgi:hypothetical protein